MTDYLNPNGVYPQLSSAVFPTNIPGISLPDDFALEAADRTLTGPETSTGQKPQAEVAAKTQRVRFPSRDATTYGEAIARLVGAFSGPGFNVIFRPHSHKTADDIKAGRTDDDLLELNLTHELWKFPAVKVDLGGIPNRVANSGEDVTLRGIPYTQIVREVTDTEQDTGTRVPVDRLGKAIDPKKQILVNDIHFEPGLFVHVPRSPPVSEQATISRMASIPHGTTINAQGAAAIKIDSKTPPTIPFSATASKPFRMDNQGLASFFDGKQFDLKNDKATRLPQLMKPFTSKNSIESITERMVQDPNELIRQHNEGKTFSQVVQFTVSTAPLQGLEKQACPHLIARDAMNAIKPALDTIDAQITATKDLAIKQELQKARTAITNALNTGSVAVNEPVAALPKGGDATQIALATARATAPAIGSANIAMLDGGQGGNPNARTGKVESTFWISTVVYTINVTDKFTPGMGKAPLQVEAVGKEKFAKDTVPSFVFPADMVVEAGKYTVEATQIQYSQNVNLIFNTLVWPHISVATVIPVRPILVNTATRVKT